MADLKKTDIAEPRNLRDDLNAIQPILKAHIISRENLAATNVQESEEDQAFANAGAIEPPYDPGVLCKLFEHSNSLRQNVDAYVTNIDGFGHRFEPVINLESDDSSEQIREALLLDRLHRQSSGDEDIDLEAMPTDQEVEDRRKKLSMQIRLEKSKLINFFDFCCVDQSFIQLRKYTRQDIEVGGNGYWEVLRNGDGDVAQFTYLPAFTVRLLPLDKMPIAVKQKIRVSPLTFKIVEMQRRFRRFVQIFQTQAIFFKEFGDPRIISKKDGRVVASEDEFEKDDPDDGPATEVWHFSVHNPESSYGVPRWIGNLLSVLGSRQSEEVNFLYFDNKGVPPLALMVSGGKLSGSSVDRIKDHIENMKGLKNFHSIMIIEAESSNTKSDAENAGRIRIDMKPLTSAQHNDALFQKYDERNIDKVGMAFRLPRMLRGDIRDFNRSCYSEDTETLTENGWKRWYEIGEGEKIAAFDPKSAAIEFVVPAERFVYPVENEEMWRFENSHTDCLVTHDHKMLVRSAQTRASDPPWETFEASKIPYDRFEVQLAAAKWDGYEIRGFDLPKVEACSIERGHSHAKAIAFDDWLEFLGYFVSEGGLVVTDHPAAPYLVYIDQKKPEIRERMRACFDRIGWIYSVQEKSCGTTHFLFSNRCLRDWLINHVGTHSHDKRLPLDYLGLSTRQLKILFNALLDGDGSRDPRENRTALAYYSASSVLAGQVQRIAIQMGMRSTIGPAAGVFRVMMSEHRTTRLQVTGQARTPASVTRESYSGMVYCFSVPGHGFFVTRRNGKIAIQGNTADAALAFAEMQVFQPERQDFDFSTNRKLLLNELGIRFWRFISNAPVTRDPEVVAKMIKDLMNSNAFTALDVRPLLEEVFNREFRTLRADWAKQPVPLTLAGIPVEESKGELETDGPKEDPFGRRRNRRRGNKKMVDAAIEEMSLSEQAVFLIKLRDALAKAEADEAEQEHREAKERVAQLKAAEDAE